MTDIRLGKNTISEDSLKLWLLTRLSRSCDLYWGPCWFKIYGNIFHWEINFFTCGVGFYLLGIAMNGSISEWKIFNGKNFKEYFEPYYYFEVNLELCLYAQLFFSVAFITLLNM